MIDFDAATACRICLENGAIYPIFEGNENHESVHAKLAVCLREKIEDIEGYPRNICIKCKNTSETICNFIKMFQKTCETLQSKIKLVAVKPEVLDNFEISDDNGNDDYSYPFELKIDKVIKSEPNAKRDPTEVLSSLSHITIKKIKVEKQTHSSNVSIKDGKTAENGNGRTVPVKNSIEKKPLNGLRLKPNRLVNTEKARIELQQFRLQETKKKAADNQAQENPATKLCDMCGETFSTAEYLSKHKKRVHLERKFKCTNCPKNYTRQRDLDEHVSKQHENVRNAICDECGKAFFTKKNVRSHKMAVHQKDQTKPKKITIHTCKFCEKTYTYKRGVVIHERSVHTGERPCVCEVCDGAFYDEVYLAEHMRIHTGHTPYKCPICGRGYTQRGNMKSHMRNHKISEIDPVTLNKLKPSYLKFMRP